jgi:hypothetical protein
VPCTPNLLSHRVDLDAEVSIFACVPVVSSGGARWCTSPSLRGRHALSTKVRGPVVSRSCLTYRSRFLSRAIVLHSETTLSTDWELHGVVSASVSPAPVAIDSALRASYGRSPPLLRVGVKGRRLSTAQRHSDVVPTSDDREQWMSQCEELGYNKGMCVMCVIG